MSYKPLFNRGAERKGGKGAGFKVRQVLKYEAETIRFTLPSSIQHPEPFIEDRSPIQCRLCGNVFRHAVAKGLDETGACRGQTACQRRVKENLRDAD